MTNLIWLKTNNNLKIFFSCLTKIRCAVVEGSHQCESLCCLLQGYPLGDSTPLLWSDVELPSGCTLFKPIQTHIYYPKDENMVLSNAAQKELKRLSQKISEQKKFIVKDTWAQWMTTVLDQIIAHEELQKVIYEHQKDFYLEDVYHRNISHESVPSNQIKKYLHEILTNAIFEYNPCKELILSSKKTSREQWSGDDVFWLSLKANPFPNVSVDFWDLFLYFLSKMLICFSVLKHKYQHKRLLSTKL